MSDMETSSLPELLDVHEPVRRERRRHRRHSRFRWVKKLRKRLTRHNWRITALMIVGFGAAIVMAGVILAMNAQSKVDNSWQSLNRVWLSVGHKPGTELTLADFERLQRSVQDLNRNLNSAEQQMGFLRPLTFVSSDLDTGLRALDAAQELTLAANDMLTGLQPTLFFLTQGEKEESVAIQTSSGERAVELLSLGRGRYLSAERHLNNAQVIIDQLQLADVSSNMLVTVDGLRDFHSQLVDINGTLKDSPDLLTIALGLNTSQSYLILAQNSDEIRPSGGYVSTYGWMTVRSGRIDEYDYSPTTITSPNPPPLELGSEINIPEWWIQYREPVYAAFDSSWYADFPSTAKMAAWYYDQGGNPQSPIDGVIAIDVAGFEYLLEGLGSVTVADFDRVIDANNFRDVIYEIRATESDLAHKRFVAAAYRQILNDWQQVDQEQSVEMRGAVLRALQEKHIMVYFTDDRLNDAMEMLGWSGKQDAGVNNDYLMVADANLGNKSDRSVIRQLTYDAQIQLDGSLQSRLSVSYDYSARMAEQDPAVGPAHGDYKHYNTIMQAFVPAGSTLISTNNLPVEPTTVQSETHTTFVSQVGVDYNASERFQLVYSTPPLVEDTGTYRKYTLKIQKQPGIIAEQANVQITLPASARVVNTSPSPDASYRLEQPILEFRLDLTTDQTIDIIYSQ